MQYHERITDPEFRKAVDLIDAGNVVELKSLLENQPGLARKKAQLNTNDYFDNPSLLEFVAENPVRHGQVSSNVREIASTIIESGADNESINSTLGLVASGRVVRECQMQKPLIALLCKNGADPDSALLAALGHGEFEAVQALIESGAQSTLPVAAATGEHDTARKLFEQATDEEKHLALALASQFGRSEVVKMLLQASVDPNRYNPDGAHAHTTPLHQAALAGHFEVVKLLVEHGADMSLRDALHNSTAADWATHGGDAATIKFLKEIETKS